MSPMSPMSLMRMTRIAVVAAIFAAGFGAGVWATAHARQAISLPAERVTGIGGVFFKARDPESLAPWDRQALGVDIVAGITRETLAGWQ